MNVYHWLAIAGVLILFLGVLAFVGAYLDSEPGSWRWFGRERGPEDSKRKWTAVSPAGSVLLGSCITYAEALQRATRLGTVAFSDMEHGIIFYNVTFENLGTRPNS